MKKVLNVKEWTQNHNVQFEPTLYYPGEATEIANAIRLSDGIEFKKGYFYSLRNPNKDIYNSAHFRILNFSLDLIHVEYELSFTDFDEGGGCGGTAWCEINDISCNDRIHVFSIKGVNLYDEYG